MSTKFCECGSILDNLIINDTIKHKCAKCKKEYPNDEYSSIVYSEIKAGSKDIYQIYEHMINFSVHDKSIPIIDFDCPNCNHFIAKQLRLGVDEIIVKVCIKCHKVFGI